MRVVVTGATGNVGSQLVTALGADPAVDEIVGIARRRPVVEMTKCRWVQADVSKDPLEPHFEGAHAVIHLAWLIQPIRDEPWLRTVNVEGTRRVAEAAARSGVARLIHASSVGTYAFDGGHQPRGESWPNSGNPASVYSSHKAEAEAVLDQVEAAHPDLAVVRLRPGLIFQRRAAAEITRYFLGPLAPVRSIGRRRLPVFPNLKQIRLQVVHATDVAEAYRLAVHSEVTGAFNIAADPVLDTADLARLFGARPVPLPAGLVRTGAAAAFALRLQPTEPGWLDLALGAPVMDTTAARNELGWRPRYDATDTVRELLDGFAVRARASLPPLHDHQPGWDATTTHVNPEITTADDGDGDGGAAGARDLLAIYLRDHRAAASGGRALAQRTAGSNAGNDLGVYLTDELIPAIERDQAFLDRVLAATGVSPPGVKLLAVRAGELVGRLKLNGRLRGYSPLSRLIEIEGLMAGIQAKRRLWVAVDTVRKRQPELGLPDPAEHIAAADDQLAQLHQHHTIAVAAAFEDDDQDMAPALDQGGSAATRSVDDVVPVDGLGR